MSDPTVTDPGTGGAETPGGKGVTGPSKGGSGTTATPTEPAPSPQPIMEPDGKGVT